MPNKETYIKYVDQLFESGHITNHGELVQLLTKRLEEYLGVKNLILVANGTLALQIAYKALELRGDIITTPFSFVASVSSAVWEDLDVTFCDINPKTFAICESQIKEKISAYTCAIVPVHVFGNACNITTIQTIAEEEGLRVIYDASHAFGVTYKGKSILSYGDISTISFHATKLFHTIEGGALVVQDDNLYENVKDMMTFGYQGPETIKCLGINAKMNEFQAAMGLCVLDEIDIILQKRKEIYEYYSKALYNYVTFQEWNIDCTNNYSYFPVVFATATQRERIETLLKNKKIYPRRYFYPTLNKLSYIMSDDAVPNAEDISSRILCLPMYPQLTKQEQDLVIQTIIEGVWL
jgi:dTDP-4-amino-4,6-dideoxygalactose transaminase